MTMTPIELTTEEECEIIARKLMGTEIKDIVSKFGNFDARKGKEIPVGFGWFRSSTLCIGVNYLKSLCQREKWDYRLVLVGFRTIETYEKKREPIYDGIILKLEDYKTLIYYLDHRSKFKKEHSKQGALL